MTQQPTGSSASSSSAQFAVQVAALRAFRDRVNGMLTSLDTGAGSAQSISAQVMTPGHPGRNFEEASAMLARYQETHNKLVQLSTTLSEAIDAMMISIDVARLGYENVDAAEEARLWAIHDQETAAAGPVQVNASSGGGKSAGSGNPRTGGGAL